MFGYKDSDLEFLIRLEGKGETPEPPAIKNNF